MYGEGNHTVAENVWDPADMMLFLHSITHQWNPQETERMADLRDYGHGIPELGQA